VLGKTFDARDLETLVDAERSRDLDDDLDKLLRDGILEEERESRGDRLTFTSGIVRDVLYAALSRRKRRSLHRKYAELIEKRSAGRLERIYPELVHHFSQADVPDKTVEYGLKLAQKSLDTFSPEEAIRVSKIALEYLEDEEWAGDPSLEGQTRLLLAEGQRMAGNVDAALREAEAAAKALSARGKPGPAVGAMLFAAETAWQARRIDDARRWIDRGLEAARSSAAGAAESDRLAKLLALAAAVANLRGEYQQAAAYQTELETLAPREKAASDEIARGGTVVVAMSNPVAAVETGTYATTEEHEVLANVFETLVTTDTQGNLAPLLCDRWSLQDEARMVRLHLRPGVVFSDGTPLTASAVKTSLERSIRLSRDAMPAAFAAIRGVAEYLDGKADGGGIDGIATPSQLEIEIGLKDPLPIFPSLLTDGRTSIVLAPPSGEAGPEKLLGTGPFQTVVHTPDRAVLERNPRFWREPPRIDRIEFKATLSAAAIAAGLRSGELDLARDLLPKDLEAVLREPRFRAGLVETPKKNSYFALFNSQTAAGSNAALRVALGSASRAQDIVWGALGRFALPATGLLPPGILGHDPGRRHPHVPREKAIEMIRSSGFSLPQKLKAAVHPILQNQYAGLTRALLQTWAELGVEVEVATKTMAEFIDAWHEAKEFDLWLGRWIADYDDPDNFTFTLFHSRNGRLRSYFSSPEADAILEEARAEARPAARESLYRKFEHLVVDSAVLVPLFHDVDYRIGGPALRGLQLHSTAPYVNYAELGKAEAPAESPTAARQAGGGILQVPIAGIVRSLDPSLSGTVEQAEIFPSIYQTLTYALDGTRIVPWLAASFSIENEGTRFRFKLRPGVRFHDGRRLTARDVRYSFERLLANPQSDNRWQLVPIRGARKLLDGEGTDLEGFHIVSPMEFFIDLDQPVSFFPALISYSGVGIVPEGTGTIGSSWRDNAVGTGPFRVVSFEPGRRLELERNPHYWREGYPRSEGVVFRFGSSAEEVREDFEAGRLSVALDLLPADVEALRHDPRFASGYREGPKLQTYFAAFNCHRGVLQDPAVRRTLIHAVDVPALVRRTLGRLAIPAHGLIPPGLLGYSANKKESGATPGGAPTDTSVQATVSRETVELSVATHPIFFGELSAFALEVTEAFRQMSFVLKPANKTMAEYLDLNRRGDADLVVGRWGADYPDADTFVYSVLHSTAGILGRFMGNAELDALIEQGRAETDPRARHSLYRKVEELVAREALLLPLFHDQVYAFARPEVEGFHNVGQTSPMINYEELWIRR
ncbi:MAG TPA: ABC transporter substrate-binding protein, partial [Thermoanaerobaculia bacterium]|nr:ABC transporter substrate-binding protein [Thermoanaerobaculia bacterium]